MSGLLAAAAVTLRILCAGSSRPEEGAYAFPTEALTLAGEYAVTAEFRETRSELTRVLMKKTAVLRSSAATFEVSPACRS
jgi:hypothetical protein